MVSCLCQGESIVFIIIQIPDGETDGVCTISACQRLITEGSCCFLYFTVESQCYDPAVLAATECGTGAGYVAELVNTECESLLFCIKSFIGRQCECDDGLLFHLRSLYAVGVVAQTGYCHRIPALGGCNCQRSVDGL